MIMKYLTLTILSSIFIYCSKKNQITNSTNKEIFKTEEKSINYHFKYFKLYKLNDTIIADLNSDKINDTIYFKKEKQTSGFIIIESNSDEEYRIGFGQKFSHLTEFNWVESWGLTFDKETFEVLIEDDEIIGHKTIFLENPSIFLIKENIAVGLITKINGEYKWIHQTD